MVHLIQTEQDEGEESRIKCLVAFWRLKAKTLIIEWGFLFAFCFLTVLGNCITE